jgi:agmatinase
MNIARNNFQKISPGTVAVVGIPLDENSSFMRGSAEGPQAIYESIAAGSTNLCAENGIDLAEEQKFKLLNVVSLKTGPKAQKQITTAVESLLAQQAKILALGGDHSITYPIIRAHNDYYDNLTILHLDAHPDLYQVYDNNPLSHACPFARILEDFPTTRLVQVGIRTRNPHQCLQASRFGVESIDMRDWHEDSEVKLNTPLYVSIDLDVLDPAYAPGVSHHEPGGMTTRGLIRIINDIKVPIIGADIVELNPHRDPLGITTMAAIKIMKELAAKMLKNA